MDGVNMKVADEKTYHHGDLRNALLSAGAGMLVDESVHTLSLRKLAKKVGVSHNAPYMHFVDKEALLAAIAEEGFRLLTIEFETAVSAATVGWYDRFEAGCCSYVAFALEHPGHMKVMIRSFDSETYPSLSQTALGALEGLQRIVQEGQELGQVKAGDGGEIAATIWALLHGISTIWTGQKMPAAISAGRTPEQLTRDFVRHFYGGLKA
jgi:AcrR family transcriptional regulator